jgi:hypothetical protein
MQANEDMRGEEPWLWLFAQVVTRIFIRGSPCACGGWNGRCVTDSLPHRQSAYREIVEALGSFDDLAAKLVAQTHSQLVKRPVWFRGWLCGGT